ncbi:DUF6249 domain-containing protein [Zoogloea sp. LCSB751]|uniref:DUF6249 domain-containing protein n=1 Tax=Zoogloea sp. LCSB751 TaxID=1965277 RepID=UPI0009A549B4|nr:DUF6249 domain-containing protein [Zoogloea sp. LCSB751]
MSIDDSSELVSILRASVPLATIVLSIGIAMLGTMLHYRRRTRIAELIHTERMAAIERGIEPSPLPPELLNGGGRRAAMTPADYLRRGLLLLFIGIAVAIALLVSSRHPERAVWGLVPAAAGAAYLLMYRLDARRQQSGSSLAPAPQHHDGRSPG